MAIAQEDYAHDQNLALCNSCSAAKPSIIIDHRPIGILLKTDTDDSISASSESNNSVDTASGGGDAKGTAASGADMPEH